MRVTFLLEYVKYLKCYRQTDPANIGLRFEMSSDRPLGIPVPSEHSLVPSLVKPPFRFGSAALGLRLDRPLWAIEFQKLAAAAAAAVAAAAAMVIVIARSLSSCIRYGAVSGLLRGGVP